MGNWLTILGFSTAGFSGAGVTASGNESLVGMIRLNLNVEKFKNGGNPTYLSSERIRKVICFIEKKKKNSSFVVEKLFVK